MLKGAEHRIADREFKATVYNAMSRAHLAHEKVQAVSMQLAGMARTIEQHERRQQQQGGQQLAAGDDALLDDVEEVMAMQLGDGGVT